MTSTATHALASVEPVGTTKTTARAALTNVVFSTSAIPTHQGFVAWCSCKVGFWYGTEDQARAAWEAHVDRIATTPRIGVDEQGREHVEGDPEQYDHEEDDRLTRQLGEWPEVPEASLR